MQHAGHDHVEDEEETCMRLRSLHSWFAALAVCLLLMPAAQAQVNLFGGSGGRGLSPEDNQMLFASIAQLNAAEPCEVGRSEA